MGGRIELICGPMFASKTSSLISNVNRYLISKKKCAVVKWKGDNRFGKESELKTHEGLTYPCWLCDDNDLWNKLDRGELDKYDLIAIDEGSFFKTIVKFCEEVANRGKVVLVASLVGTSEREGFNDILNLIPKCDAIHFSHAVCMNCFRDGASFTYRTCSNNEIEFVGAAESYKSVCRECYFKLKKV